MEAVHRSFRIASDLASLEPNAFAEALFSRTKGEAIDPAGLREVLELLELGAAREDLVLAVDLSDAARKWRGEDEPADRPPPLQALLQLPEAEFIAVAFRHLLGRAPDLQGAVAYLRQLRSGRSRLAILTALRNSTESRVFGRTQTRPWRVMEMCLTPSVSLAQRAWLLLVALGHGLRSLRRRHARPNSPVA